MHFKPKTEKEIAEENLWPAGEYSFHIATSTDEVSKNGNEMIKLGLNVYSGDGRCQIVYDYLLEAIPHKLRHLCAATGLMDKYEQGTLYAIDLVDKTGVLKLFIQKDKTGAYPDKNAVADYLLSKTEGIAVPTNTHAIIDDQIPF